MSELGRKTCPSMQDDLQKSPKAFKVSRASGFYSPKAVVV